MLQATDGELPGSREDAPISPVPTVAMSTPKSDLLSLPSLSFVIHPSHEATSNKHGSPDQGDRAGNATGEPILIARACYTLDISPTTMHRL